MLIRSVIHLIANFVTGILKRRLFVNKFRMVSNNFMTLLYKLWSQYDTKIYRFDDPNQCSPVEGGSQISYNYFEKSIMFTNVP